MTSLVSLDGRVVPAEDARVSVFDRGFLYGDSVFEALRTYGGVPFALTEHLERCGERRARADLHPVTLDTFRNEILDALAAARIRNRTSASSSRAGGARSSASIRLSPGRRFASPS
jgi:branched-chain amino acid aminotransferase